MFLKYVINCGNTSGNIPRLEDTRSIEAQANFDENDDIIDEENITHTTKSQNLQAPNT
jgi:hypothetical protein